MRWMYASANPAVNLRFGYGPGHEVVRRFFLPLWNTYGFLVDLRPSRWLDTRPDRWRSTAHEPCSTAGSCRGSTAWSARSGTRSTDTTPWRATRAIEAFVDDLSNWYVRRNRRRFWKGELDADKRAAYATLHEVLTTLARLLAPIIPHLADAMWDNLVAAVDAEAPDSVHLTDVPTRVAGRTDAAVEDAVDLARRTVALGRTARAASGVRTRQPLRAVRVKLPGGRDRVQRRCRPSPPS